MVRTTPLRSKDVTENHRCCAGKDYTIRLHTDTDGFTVLGTVVPDPLQRFSHIKVEATSFIVSGPFAPLTVAPLVYDKALDAQRAILRDEYDVMPFSVNTIRLERIFVDKVFATEFYYQRRDYFDVSKYIYDLSVTSDMNEI